MDTNRTKWREQARRRHDLEYRLDAQQHEAAGLTYRQDMALLALDLFARIIAARIDAAPLFPRFSRSGIDDAAVGLASRSMSSRHFT